jgi:hypothetical protein
MKKDFNGLTSSLNLHVVDDAHEAIKQGFFYRPPVYKPLRIDKIVIVRNGTVNNNATVDIVLEDENGQKFITLVSMSLLKTALL